MRGEMRYSDDLVVTIDNEGGNGSCGEGWKDEGGKVTSLKDRRRNSYITVLGHTPELFVIKHSNSY